MVKIRSKIKFLKTSFFYELVKLETLKKIFVMCHSIFALPIPPPGLPWVKMKMRMQFREWGSSFSCSSQRGVRFYSDGLPRPGGGMGNAKIEWHIREKIFSKFPFRPIRIKMLVSKFWFLTNFYLVNFAQLNQKCGIVSSSSNSFVLIGKKIIKSFHFVQFGKNCVFWEFFSWKWPFTPSNLRRIFKERVGFEPTVRLIILLESVQGTCNNLKSVNGMRR